MADEPQLLYRDSGAILYRGDSLDVMAKMPTDGNIGLILTDPPYAVDFRGRWEGYWQDRPMIGDRSTAWIEPAFAEMYRVAAPDSYCCTFYGWPQVDAFMSAWKRIGWKPVSHIAVVKRMLGLGIHTRSRHETMYCLVKGKPRPIGPALHDVILSQEPEPRKGRLHPAQKPIEPQVRIIRSFCPEQQFCFDPFTGVATTMVAAMRAGRKVIGVELDPNFAALAAQRLRQERQRLAAAASSEA